ncbi:hypothetical protein [Paenibacillus piscarius]|uniref:hypothetical protein n=1 Tax=Paenibacillus piscarius TaxID=1089681 RepID=UPI001EE7C6F6|nr:hypothetical protein [Paenibacillus piscarius]
MPEHTHDEADIRNRENKDGDSLAERKKMENGVDIEPEADDWEAKPADTAHPDPLPKN